MKTKQRKPAGLSWPPTFWQIQPRYTQALPRRLAGSLAANHAVAAERDAYDEILRKRSPLDIRHTQARIEGLSGIVLRADRDVDFWSIYDCITGEQHRRPILPGQLAAVERNELIPFERLGPGLPTDPAGKLHLIVMYLRNELEIERHSVERNASMVKQQVHWCLDALTDSDRAPSTKLSEVHGIGSALGVSCGRVDRIEEILRYAQAVLVAGTPYEHEVPSPPAWQRGKL